MWLIMGIVQWIFGMKTGASNPSAVTLIQRMWLEICCWCSKGQKKMTFGKTLKPLASLWRTDRCPCQQPPRGESFPQQNFDKSCPQWCLLIMLSKDGAVSECATPQKAILDLLALAKWLETGHWKDIFSHTANEEFWVPACRLSQLACW